MLPILSVLLLVSVISADPTSMIDGACTRNSECASDHCCLLSPIKYAVPACMPLQNKDELCRVNANTMTTNLTYPDNTQLEVHDINYILCPCANGLTCDAESGGKCI